MPKTVNGLWDTVVEYQNLHDAYVAARSCKRYRGDVLSFWGNLEENLIDIQNRLIWQTWAPSRLNEFMVYLPKPRLIGAPPFRDRVVHHALVNVVGPLFERKFIAHSYACRVDRGNHAAVRYLRQCLMRSDLKGMYAIKADISKYFASIDHAVLLDKLARTIRDKTVLWLCEQIVRCSGYDGVGLPVGALTSQLFANVYMDSFDHYIKDDMGVKAYVRYMDDFIVLCPDKQSAHATLDQSVEYINGVLRLKMNPKTSIFPVGHGIDFCGYRVWHNRVLPRKRNVYRARRHIRRVADDYVGDRCSLGTLKMVYCSFAGYMKHCARCKTMKHLSQEITQKLLEKSKIRYCQKAAWC